MLQTIYKKHRKKTAKSLSLLVQRAEFHQDSGVANILVNSNWSRHSGRSSFPVIPAFQEFTAFRLLQ